MPRKTKTGIDYFSHDVDMLQDKKIKLIKAKHGLVGYAVYLRLLEELYRENGYYINIDDDFNVLFSDDNNIDYNAYINILNDCIEKGLFSGEMFEKYDILTSGRIQKNYCSATERRKEVIFFKEYLLIKPAENYNTSKVKVNILSLNADIKAEKANKSTQSKVKESKGKKKKTSFSNEFEKCWEIVPKRNGIKIGKKPAGPLFEKLSLDDKRKCYTGLINYSDFCDKSGQNPRDFERFIKHRTFDEFQNPVVVPNKAPKTTSDHNAEFFENRKNNRLKNQQTGNQCAITAKS